MTRRGFFRRTAVVAGLLAAAGGGAACQQLNQIMGPKAPIKITWAGQGGSYMEAVKKYLWEPFSKENNVEIEFVAASTTAVLARLRAEKGAPSLDFLGTGEGVVVSMRAEGLVDKMDVAKVPNMANVLPTARNDEGYPPQGAAIANVIYYNSEFVKTPPTSWADLWKPEFKGKVSYPDIPNTTGLHLLLMAAKIAQGDTSTNSGEKFVNDAAFKKMKDLLPNTYTIYGVQTAFDGMAALKSGEVWLHVSGLVGETKTVLNQPNSPIKALVTAKEGIPNSPLTLAFVKGSKVPAEMLNKLLNAHLNKEVAIGIADMSDFVPTLNLELPPNLASVLPKPSAMLRSDWKLISENRPAWTERWNKEILAAK